MDIIAAIDELGDAVDTIDGLRVYRYAPDNVHAPAAVVAYPTVYEFDATYSRGMDTFTVPVVVLVDRGTDRTSRDELLAYVAGSGPRSIKAAVEAHEPASYDTARVTGAEFDVISLGGVEYVAATFPVEISGQGAP